MKYTHAEYALIFRALSDETRVKTIQMLSSGELCACEILKNVRITQPTLSYHMKILCDSGLVIGRRDGTWMKYSLNQETVAAVKALFDGLGTHDEQALSARCSTKRC